MKIATHVLLFGQEKWIMRNIENAYPHVDKIYIAYSKFPWTYNPNARNVYQDDFDILKIRQSKFADKVQIIEGVWDTEEAQRNACVDHAIKDEMDFLIIHDADEFYFHDTFSYFIDRMKTAPDFDYYMVDWICFWKSFKYCLVNSIGSSMVGSPEFAINLKRGVRFLRKRKPTKDNWYRMKSSIGSANKIEHPYCFHGSYVLTNEELLQKINTWGHTNDFDKEYWYNEKWLKWTPEMRDLHLVSPSAWSQAVEFKGELPEVIRDLK